MRLILALLLSLAPPVLAGEIYLNAGTGVIPSSNGCSYSNPINGSTNSYAAIVCSSTGTPYFFLHSYVPADVPVVAGKIKFTPIINWRTEDVSATNACFEVTSSVCTDSGGCDWAAATFGTAATNKQTINANVVGDDGRWMQKSGEGLSPLFFFSGATSADCTSACLNQPVAFKITRKNSGCSSNTASDVEILGVRLNY